MRENQMKDAKSLKKYEKKQAKAMDNYITNKVKEELDTEK